MSGEEKVAKKAILCYSGVLEYSRVYRTFLRISADFPHLHNLMIRNKGM